MSGQMLEGGTDDGAQNLFWSGPGYIFTTDHGWKFSFTSTAKHVQSRIALSQGLAEF